MKQVASLAPSPPVPLCDRPVRWLAPAWPSPRARAAGLSAAETFCFAILFYVAAQLWRCDRLGNGSSALSVCLATSPVPRQLLVWQAAGPTMHRTGDDETRSCWLYVYVYIDI